VPKGFINDTLEMGDREENRDTRTQIINSWPPTRFFAVVMLVTRSVRENSSALYSGHLLLLGTEMSSELCRCCSSELGTRSRSAENPAGMSNVCQKEIIAVQVREFVSACIYAGNDSHDTVMWPIHDQSCCAKLFCATQVCPFTIKSNSTIHDQSCCTTRNVAQHD
jgi:hypothetical protein